MKNKDLQKLFLSKYINKGLGGFFSFLGITGVIIDTVSRKTTEFVRNSVIYGGALAETPFFRGDWDLIWLKFTGSPAQLNLQRPRFSEGIETFEFDFHKCWHPFFLQRPRFSEGIETRRPVPQLNRGQRPSCRDPVFQRGLRPGLRPFLWAPWLSLQRPRFSEGIETDLFTIATYKFVWTLAETPFFRGDWDKWQVAIVISFVTVALQRPRFSEGIETQNRSRSMADVRTPSCRDPVFQRGLRRNEKSMP